MLGQLIAFEQYLAKQPIEDPDHPTLCSCAKSILHKLQSLIHREGKKLVASAKELYEFLHRFIAKMFQDEKEKFTPFLQALSEKAQRQAVA